MKELIIFNPSIEDGGVEKNLYLITNYLCEKDLNISIISTDIEKKKKFKKKVNFISPKFINYSYSGRYLKYFFCLLVLIFKILSSRNLVVLAFQANIYALIICKLLRIKIITRLNTAPQGWEHNNIKKTIYSLFIKKADLIIVNSKEFKREVDKRYNINSKCILNPFDFKKIKKLSKVKIKKLYKKNSLKIINVARLTGQKDQLVLLKALKEVLPYRRIELIIIGKGRKVNDELINFINDNKLQKYARLLGYKANPFPYIKQAEIFILSSKYEGSPNILTECQFLKKFIISTNCPTGPKEILKNGKYGYLFKVGDYKNLANILKKIKINNNHKKMINAAFKNIKKYDYNLICNEYYDAIKKFI